MVEPTLQSGETRNLRTARRALLAAVVAGWCGSVAPAPAAEIYHWIDDAGAVHYSDKPPSFDAPVTVIEIESSPLPAYNAAEDPYSILNQAARTHETWLELEAVRQARVQQRIEAIATAGPGRPAPAEYDSYLEYSSYYPYYAYWPATGNDYRPGEARDQVYALHTLDLLGPRPASINSGVHQDRVFRSQFLPLVPPAPAPPRPQPLPR